MGITPPPPVVAPTATSTHRAELSAYPGAGGRRGPLGTWPSGSDSGYVAESELRWRTAARPMF